LPVVRGYHPGDDQVGEGAPEVYPEEGVPALPPPRAPLRVAAAYGLLARSGDVFLHRDAAADKLGIELFLAGFSGFDNGDHFAVEEECFQKLFHSLIFFAFVISFLLVQIYDGGGWLA